MRRAPARPKPGGLGRKERQAACGNAARFLAIIHPQMLAPLEDLQLALAAGGAVGGGELFLK
jgi:hypothetical protein